MTASNLQSVRGDTFVFSMYVFNAGVQVDLTGAAVRFTAKHDYADLDAAAVVALDTSVGGGVEIVNAAAGELRVTVPAADTAALWGDGRLWGTKLLTGLGSAGLNLLVPGLGSAVGGAIPGGSGGGGFSGLGSMLGGWFGNGGSGANSGWGTNWGGDWGTDWGGEWGTGWGG
jgi:hypothetical protein